MAKKTTRKTAKPAQKAVKKAAKKTVKKTAAPAPKAVAKKPTPKAFQKGGIFADVEHLMDIMVTHDVTEVAIEDGKRKINLRRGAFVAPAVGVAPVAAPAAAPAPVAAPAAAPVEEAKPADNCVEITSPMVGTFYAAPSPDAEPYAQLGDKINDATVVCIVEAMKVMNEIKAECSGEIVEVCVKNAEPVEFGQVLFRVKP